jgi:hypothetical protein
LEIIRPIGFAFSEDSVLNEMKDDLTHLSAVLDSPVIQNGLCHRSELLESQLPEPFEQLMASNVGRLLILRPNKFPKGLIQGAPNEIIGGR